MTNYYVQEGVTVENAEEILVQTPDLQLNKGISEASLFNKQKEFQKHGY